jgi:hypothetical protein
MLRNINFQGENYFNYTYITLFLIVFTFLRFKCSSSMIEVCNILTNEMALKNKSKCSRRTSVPHVCAPISTRNEIESLRYILKYQSCTRFFKDFCNRM